MRWLKRETWKAGIAIAGMLLLLVLVVWVPVSAAGAHERASGLATPVTGTVQATPAVNPTIEAETANEQLKKLQRDNERSFNAWFWNNGAALISSLALALAGVFAIVRYFSDRSEERVRQKEEQDRWLKDRDTERERRGEEQQRWLKDQEVEREKRDEERFQSVVEGLGSEREEAKVGAAITLRTFLRPGYERFYTQTFDLAVAHLRLPRTSASSEDDSDAPLPLTTLSQALITVFKEAFPRAKKELKQKDPQFSPQALDASGIRLDRAFLVQSDLQHIWMREASLNGAHLRGAHLNGAYLRRTHLRGALLHDADLRGANLSATDLSGARLSRADLGGVDLSEANLEEARSLEHTNLRGVKGLTKEQLEACKARGAIIDEDSTASPPQSPVSPSPPSQSNDAQAQSPTPVQESTPTPDTDESRTTSSQPGAKL